MEIGPLLGYLCGGTLLQLDWQEYEFVRRVVLLGKERGVEVILFTPEDLNLGERTVRGFSLAEEGEELWHQATYPFPKIIYNRVGSLESRKAEERYRRLFAVFQLENPGLTIFNPGGLDKWTFYQNLRDRGNLHFNLPETALYSRRSLEMFLEKFPSVYLKPRALSHGKGIIRLTPWPWGQLFCEYHKTGGKKEKGILHNLEEVQGLLLPKNQYLVQQGVKLAALEGRPVDFRLHLHKDGQGCWQVAGVLGRRGPKQGVVTHGGYRGTCEDAVSLLEALFPGHGRRYLQRLEEYALGAVRLLEETSPPILAEVGLDLGFDREGEPWLFEANERPTRVLFRFVRGVGKRVEEGLACLLLAFTLYLSGFTVSFPSPMTVEGVY